MANALVIALRCMILGISLCGLNGFFFVVRHGILSVCTPRQVRAVIVRWFAAKSIARMLYAATSQIFLHSLVIRYCVDTLATTPCSIMPHPTPICYHLSSIIYHRIPLLRSLANYKAISTSMTTLRPTCVIAREIRPDFFMRLAVGKLQSKISAIPNKLLFVTNVLRCAIYCAV